MMKEEAGKYTTLAAPAEALFKDRGSKFLAYAYPISEPKQAKPLIDALRKEHPKAVHFCYAYRIGTDGLQFRSADDGEPAGSAGKPILGQIDSAGVTDVLVVVVRYFGGTLLGVSGLINAYKLAAADALNNADIVERTVNEIYRIHFEYLQMNDVMKIIKDEKLEIISQNHELNCETVFSVRKSTADKVTEQLNKVTGNKAEYLRTV